MIRRVYVRVLVPTVIGLAAVASVMAHGGSNESGSRRTSPVATAPATTSASSFEGSSKGYRLSIDFGRKPRSEADNRATLRLTRSGTPVTQLAIVHTKPMHLIGVSENLGHFLHLHPEARTDGRLDLDVRFPEAGRWTFFADFTESGQSQTVVRVPVNIDGEHEDQHHELRPTPRLVIDRNTGTMVQYSTEGEHLQTGENTITFRLMDDTGPVTNLQDVLGAKGHLVVIRKGAASAEDYVHAHPLEHGGEMAEASHNEMPEADHHEASSGNAGEVVFHVDFPKPGRYKMWAEFNRGGRQVLVDYVVDVEAAHASREPATTSETYYTCPMHPEVRQASPGSCPRCGMTLKQRRT